MAPPAQKEPGAQACPSASPGGSLKHVVEADDEVARPVVQVVQVVLEVMLLKNPWGQLMHAVALNRYRPGTQGRQ